MAGAHVRRMMAWVPQSGNIGIGVSILSYAGGVQFGLIADKRLCDDPQRIIDRFEPEFEKLVLTLCMLPWEGAVDADGAESWMFPSVVAPKRAPRKGRTRRKAAAHTTPAGDAGATPPGTATAAESDVASAGEKAARPAGVRRRKSAFAAARGAG
jgi:hypothetical protein